MSMLVSTAFMLSLDFTIHRGFNLLVRQGDLSGPLENAGEIADGVFGDPGNGTEQDSFGRGFDGELRAGNPRSGGAQFLGQYDLAFG